MAHNPEHRSSMLEVAASLSDVANITVKRNTSRSLRDTVKVDGERAKPMAKK